MHKRITVIFCVIALLMTGVMYRIYYIDMSDYLVAASASQGNYALNIAQTRGGIYDRNLQPLVNNRHEYRAAVLPTPQSAAVLLERAPGEERQALLERLSGAMPFVLALEDNDVYATGIDVFSVPLRYDEEPVAPHIIGYLGGEGKGGVAGIEGAYDDFLTEQGGALSARYQVDAMGRALQGGKISILRSGEKNLGGVVLTIDKDIQLAAQRALEAGWDKGAVVVLDIASGDILAMASTPAFDPGDIAASLESEDAPFINRAISGYNIGSVFKLIVAAAALENNISRYHPYECEGYIDVDGQIFHCNNHAVHGALDMQRALEVSCNTYFINLAQMLGPGYIRALCEHMGLGSSVELAPGLATQSGNLPSGSELANPAGLANFSFGQGSSLASPLQMAQVVATIAGGGSTVSPRLVRGFTLDGEALTEDAESYAGSRLLGEHTAETLKELMVAVVEDGSGKPAQPAAGGAGGKTSSAQTGHMREDGDKELVHAWFAGFCPADTPKYAVVVFCEGGESGERVAAPIFRQLANSLLALEK